MEIEVEIFNMNDMTRDIYEKLDASTFFKNELEIVSHLNKKNGFFNLLGIEIDGFRYRVCDRDKFIMYIFERYFPDYKVERTRKEGVGQPDYTLTKEEDIIYLELKFGLDSIRQSQMKWFVDNKDKNCKVIFIDHDEDFSSLREGEI